MMDNLLMLMAGFAAVLTPENIMWSLLGVTLGTAIGVLPGIGPALTIALLLPVTYQLSPTAAFVIFGGIYYGAAYGASTTSILVNTPGETGSVVTAIEGYQMARRGRAGAALATAAIGSFVAGMIGTVLLALFAPVFADLALLFGPAEYFALACLGFAAVSSMLGASPLHGLASLFVGLALGLVGTDPQSSVGRFTGGSLELFEGVGITVAAVGMFAIGETLWLVARGGAGESAVTKLNGLAWMSREDWSRSWKPWLRGAAIGFPFGALPAGGTEVPTFLSYTVEKKLSRKPEEFGNGAIEGVAGPEATNNAAVAGILVPLLTFGLPTSATAAIMLAAFQQYGIQPGPMLFSSNGELVWAIIASLFVGNVALLVLNLPMIGLWVRLLSIPQPLLYAGVLLFSLVGIFAASNSIYQMMIATGLGILAFVLRLGGFPIAPAIVGLVLGPIAEVQLRRSLQISQGDWTTFIAHPISTTLLCIAVLAIVVPMIAQLKPRRSV
jgi:putative tricarboxylic transport membrane protein